MTNPLLRMAGSVNRVATHRSAPLRAAALAALAAGFITLGAGCETHPTPAEQRPDISSLQPGDRGIQSKDLVEMTDQLAPQLIQIPEIVQNPNKITVVMTGIDNKTSQPYADLTIFLARLRGKLATESHDKIAFYEKKATTANLQQTEGAGGNSDPFEEGSRTGIAPPPSRVVPNYALKGEFYDQPNVQTTYHLCQFELTNIQTGQIVWTGTYEVRTLN